MLRKLGVGAARLALLLMVPIYIGAIITNVPLFGPNNATGLPEVPSVDQVTMDKATASQGGELLTSSGYRAAIKISDEGIIELLDQEEKKAGQANPGPYVVFSLGKPRVALAEDNIPADAVVDVSNGAIVALIQEFTNKRGSVCFNAKAIDILAGNWVVINVYLNGKSLNQQIPVTRELVPQLASGFPDTQCYVFPTS